MHFTARKSSNFPYYLFKNLGKMIETIQPKGDKHIPSLSHFSLIKLLVLHELGNRKMSWESFLSDVGFLAHAVISPM